MKPREVKLVGPVHDRQAYILAIPSVENGLFVQTHGINDQYVDMGQIAIVSGIEPVTAELIQQGDEDLFHTFHEMDLGRPGRELMLNRARVAVVNRALANFTMTEVAVEQVANFSKNWVEEFEPYVSERI